MTTTSPSTTKTTTQRHTVLVAQAAARPRREYRARDFGIGYGNSSGYASGKRYTDNWGNARFHCG